MKLWSLYGTQKTLVALFADILILEKLPTTYSPRLLNTYHDVILYKTRRNVSHDLVCSHLFLDIDGGICVGWLWEPIKDLAASEMV